MPASRTTTRSASALPTMRTFKARILRLASYKINGYSLYMENVVRRPGHETETRADGLTPAQLQDIAALCARYHMAFVPEQETFAHLESLLQNPAYADVRENPDVGSGLITPAAARTYDVLRHLLTGEFSGIEGLHLIHIGGDEPFELGTGRSAALVRNEGYARVYGEHMAKVAAIVHALHARPLMWGNELIAHPEIARYLPRDTIVIPYDYDDDVATFPRLIRIPQRAGFALLAAPSTRTYAGLFSDLPVSSPNLHPFPGQALRDPRLGLRLTYCGACCRHRYDPSRYPIQYRAPPLGGE